VVTHDARLVPYADRVFHLDDGHLSEPEPGVIPMPRGEPGAELSAAV
jgi:ABC-type lipoprotein export system ATPase subunit